LEGLNGSATFFGSVGDKISLKIRDFFFNDAEYDTEKSTKDFREVLLMDEYIITTSNVADFNYKINYSFFSAFYCYRYTKPVTSKGILSWQQIKPS
jgi:hypothetical protein